MTGLPAYVVFPESARADSADLDFVGRFSVSKIQMQFNDNWFQKVNCKQGRSCAFGLNQYGSVVFETQIDKIDSIALHNYIRQNQPSDEVPDGSLFAYTDSLQFKFEDRLGRLVVSNRYKEKVLYKIKSSSFDLSLISNQLSGIKKEKFLKYGIQINKEMTAFICRFVSFRIKDDSTILLCLLYHNTPDSISPNITDDYAFIEYSMDGNVRNVKLADIPIDIVVYSPSFISDSGNIYVTFWRLNSHQENEPDNWDTARYIARFTAKGERYVLDSIMPQKIPWYYAQRKTYNYLSLAYSSYPYITSYLGNEITDLLTGKTIEIIPNEVFRKKIDFSKDGGSFDQALENFHCYGINVDKKKDEIISIFKSYNVLNIGRYDKNLNKISYTTIKYDFFSEASFIWASIYPEINLIEMRIKVKNSEFRQYYLPLDLFY